MIWRSIKYDWPEAAFLLFILVLITGMFYFLNHYRQTKLQSLADDDVLKNIVEKRSPAIFWLKTIFLLLIWVCGVLALMQPKGNERYLQSAENESVSSDGKVKRKMHEVVLLLDASASMGIADANNGKTRLEMVKQIGDDLISKLKGENISLLVFTGATIQLVPSTMDYLFARIMLRQIGIDEGETVGTDIKQALESFKKGYLEPSTTKSKTLILVSDGGDTHYESLKGEEKQQALVELVAPLKDAADQNLTVFALGVGSVLGGNVPGVSYEGQSVHSVLDEELMRKIGVVGQGEFIKVSDRSSQQIVDMIMQSINKRTTFESENINQVRAQTRTPIYDLYFQVPLGIAILLLSLVLLLPDTTLRRKIL